MFLFRSEEENKAIKLKDLSFDNTPEFTFKGRNFLSKILDVYDGDTITITIKVDGEYSRTQCRLMGLDSPEMKSKDEDEKKAAHLSRSHLMFLLTGKKIENETSREQIKKICAETNAIVNVKCLDFDKYGRLLVEIWANSINVNEKMISDGFAGPYDGGTKSDWRSYFKHL